MNVCHVYLGHRKRDNTKASYLRVTWIEHVINYWPVNTLSKRNTCTSMCIIMYNIKELFIFSWKWKSPIHMKCTSGSGITGDEYGLNLHDSRKVWKGEDRDREKDD